MCVTAGLACCRGFCSLDGNHVLSGHLDGSIYRFTFDANGRGPTNLKIATHSVRRGAAAHTRLHNSCRLTCMLWSFCAFCRCCNCRTVCAVRLELGQGYRRRWQRPSR